MREKKMINIRVVTRGQNYIEVPSSSPYGAPGRFGLCNLIRVNNGDEFDFTDHEYALIGGVDDVAGKKVEIVSYTPGNPYKYSRIEWKEIY